MKSIPVAERLEAGKALRQQLTRAAQGEWRPSATRRDPVEVLELSNRGRMPELIPLRYGRMLRSPFTFLRGAAAVMADDLGATPTTGVMVQACGDCHLANFGLFATPERNLIFDINDFDETLRAPWEWDLKRLVTSFVVAGRDNGFSEQQCAAAVSACARSYREHLREFAELSPLEIWYFRVAAEDLIERAEDDSDRQLREQMASKARNRVGAKLFPKITEEVAGRYRFVENPPLVTRVTGETEKRSIERGIRDYRGSLPEDRRYLFDRYRLEDFALRVVGVGSVGTRCYVALLVCDDMNPLLLQIKEARASVLQAHAPPTAYPNQGQRVVVGQRLMQAASDMFLGWLCAESGRDYYVRQLRDMKFSVPIDVLPATGLGHYAEVCGWTLARAHAKSGDAATIGGYLGGGDKMETALCAFAMAYADQTEQDHAALVRAAREGRIEVLQEAN